MFFYVGRYFYCSFSSFLTSSYFFYFSANYFRSSEGFMGELCFYLEFYSNLSDGYYLNSFTLGFISIDGFIYITTSCLTAGYYFYYFFA